MKHTELPWEVIKDGELVYIDSGSINICDLYHMHENGAYTKYDAEANAAFIAKACNNHESLLGALKDLMASISGGSKSCGHDYTCVCSGDAARAAIKQAEEKK